MAEKTLLEQALRSVSRFGMNIPKWEVPDETQINIQSNWFVEKAANKIEEKFQKWFKSKDI